jgi:hypothetical protein
LSDVPRVVIVEQNNKASVGKKRDLNALLRRGDTWSVDQAGI